MDNKLLLNERQVAKMIGYVGGLVAKVPAGKPRYSVS